MQKIYKIIGTLLEEIVWEFYANVYINSDDDILMVRGKPISFLMDAINIYFCLEAFDLD